MNLTTATPVEIDTELARIYGEIGEVNSDTNEARTIITRVDEVEPGSYSSHFWTPEKRAAAVARIEANDAKFYALHAEAAPLEARYATERWNRYYLVDNNNGHVHTHTACRTCYDTTQFVWLVDFSGADHGTVTEEAGELSCAECFPNLPAEIMKRKTRIEDPAKRKTRLEREAAKAAREAKRLEKALLPTGEPLKVSLGMRQRADHRKGGMVDYEETKTLETLAQARTWLTDSYWWSTGNPSFPADARQIIAEAVATKEGKTVEVVLAEAQKRAAKRK